VLGEEATWAFLAERLCLHKLPSPQSRCRQREAPSRGGGAGSRGTGRRRATA